MTGPTVVVTAVGGGGNGEQIVKALRASSLGYTIVGTDMQPYSKGLYEVDVSYLVPGANDRPTSIRSPPSAASTTRSRCSTAASRS